MVLESLPEAAVEEKEKALPLLPTGPLMRCLLLLLLRGASSRLRKESPSASAIERGRVLRIDAPFSKGEGSRENSRRRRR